MAQLCIEREKKSGSGINYIFKSEGLDARADFDSLTGVAKVKFEEATNMASALEAVISTLQDDARLWGTNPIFPLRIDIEAGKFEKELTEIAPRFGFEGPQAAGEFSVDQFVRFRGEFPLAG